MNKPVTRIEALFRDMSVAMRVVYHLRSTGMVSTLVVYKIKPVDLMISGTSAEPTDIVKLDCTLVFHGTEYANVLSKIMEISGSALLQLQHTHVFESDIS